MVIEDVPVPVITVLDEVLIQVKAASVDLVDIKICSGYGRVLRKQLSRYNNVSSDCVITVAKNVDLLKVKLQQFEIIIICNNVLQLELCIGLGQPCIC